ncbi:MAG TPA: beta-galactosidase GalA [Acidobacteriaceae bacterium]|nr:beta-galactosidase GalA [Acidobacteriaceae bacterium]
MFSPSRRQLLQTGLAASAASLLPHTALARVDEWLAWDEQRPNAVPGPREQYLMDFNWKFTFGNLNDPAKDLGFFAFQSDYISSKTGSFTFATAKFDDAKWRALNLPHDWAIELPFVDDQELMAHGFKPLGRKYPDTSVGWYRKSFNIPASDFGRRIWIEFDGAMRTSLVFLNGCYIGRNDSGYTPFRFDVTDFINYGGENYIVVRVDASKGDGWFYEGAGIYRHVWLTKFDPLHLGRWESWVRADVKGHDAALSLGTVVRNRGKKAETAVVHWKILDTDGKQVGAAASAPQSIEPDGEGKFIASATVRDAVLWSPETPHMYSAIVSVETSGTVRDGEEVPFGVRSIRFDVNKGFFLNGEPVKIKGTCNHQDHAGVGAAVPDAIQRYRVAVLKAMDSNAVRTSHNMPTPEWVQACDRMGMMMMCETRAMSSSAEGLAELETMIKRYRNSPSIIIWSMGNEEVIIEGQPIGEHIVRTMVERSHELDPTRQCTAAINQDAGKGASLALDVEGINYSLGIIDGYHRDHPNQPLIGSETASTVSTRGTYLTDKLRNWVSAYDVNRPPWAELAQEWWQFYAAREFLSGGFAWTGFDYRGEPTPYGWPSINSQFGIVDTCGFPKDLFYYYKASWGKEPVLHLFPHWNWDERIGEPVTVWVFSNLDEVELFHNGQSQGRQKMPALGHLEWKVKYEPGSIEARGYKGGQQALTAKRETTGPVASLKLTADRTAIDADGRDCAVIRVEGVDSEGRTVPLADDLVEFRVSGEGRFLGVGNGDPNCQESDIEPKRSLFKGLAQLIVESTANAGSIQIEAKTQEGHIAPAQLTITTGTPALPGRTL